MNMFSNNRGGRTSSLGSLFKFHDVSDKTKTHLTEVYTLLMVCCFICASGMYVNAAYIMSGFFMNVISIILSVYLIF